MFLREIVGTCLLIGIALVIGAGRNWLSPPHWRLFGAALVDIASVFAIHDSVTKHNHWAVVGFLFSIVFLTIEAIRKYNKLRQATA